MSSKKIRLGFIGAGAFISARHLKTAGETPYMEIRAIADLDRERLAEHQKKYQIGYVTDDYRKLLADPEIDLIVIGTKQDTHARLIIESLNAGKWVWCEKPMCETREEEAAILEAEKNAAGRLAIGFNRRFAPAILKIRQVLTKLPRPWIISYRLQSANSYNKSSRNSFYHGRPHIIYEGCHILDLAAFLMESQPERVFMSGTDDENDIVTMEYPDGSRFVLVITTRAGGIGLEKEMMEVGNRIHTGRDKLEQLKKTDKAYASELNRAAAEYDALMKQAQDYAAESLSSMQADIRSRAEQRLADRLKQRYGGLFQKYLLKIAIQGTEERIKQHKQNPQIDTKQQSKSMLLRLMDAKTTKINKSPVVEPTENISNQER